MTADTRIAALEREVARLSAELEDFRRLHARNYITTQELSRRWGLTPRTLQRYRSDPTHALVFDVDRNPGNAVAGKAYSRALIERIERSWGAR